MKKQVRTRSLTATDLAERTAHRRAVEAVIWGMAAVNFDLMNQAMVRKTNGAFNQIVYWSRLPDWRNQTLTPNPDSIYLMPFFNTKDVGPMVLEIPPADEGTIVGSVMDIDHRPVSSEPRFVTSRGPAGRRRHRESRKAQTVPSISTSDRRLRPERRPTGFPPAPAARSKFCFASTVRRNPSSKRPGDCPTS